MAEETKEAVKKTAGKTAKKPARKSPSKKLVIVESPGKVKNIKKYLMKFLQNHIEKCVMKMI